MAKNDGGPAFPRPDVTWPVGHEHGTEGQSGMSTRTWLAGQAMKGLMSNPVSWAKVIAQAAEFERSQAEQLAKMACHSADALLAELERDR